MRTSTPTATQARIQSFVEMARAGIQGWNRFWFAPADPTLLGFLRILCGLVTLYVHLSYCTDLKEFFGTNACVNQGTIHQFGTEWGWYPSPFDWHETVQEEPYARG